MVLPVIYSTNTNTCLPRWFHLVIFLSYCQVIQFIEIVLTQPTHFSIRIDFVYTHLNVKTVLY